MLLDGNLIKVRITVMDVNFLWDQFKFIKNIPEYKPKSPIVINYEMLFEVLEKYKERVDFLAKRLAKEAIKNVQLLSNMQVYKNLNNSEEKASAAVAELFRNTDLVLNSGYLDMHKLQNSILNSIASNPEHHLIFELGWGQAKRDSGQLKSFGENADFGEFIAIIRLGIIIRAAQWILNKKVCLRIITGGQRFYEAFFTNKDSDISYNRQRKAFVSLIGLDDDIAFEDISRYYSSSQIVERMDDVLSGYKLSSPQDVPQFKFVLFNIDWYNILGIGDREGIESPHGLSAPPYFLSCLHQLSIAEQKQLLRELLASIANSDIDIHLFEPFLAYPSLIHDVREWIKHVGAISCLKYDTIGKVTVRTDQTDHGGPVLMTVIDKRNNPHIPTLMLLGKGSGELVPQHVVPVLKNNGTMEYFPYMLVVNQYHPVYVEIGQDDLLSPWSMGRGQPLLFTDSDIQTLTRQLKQYTLVDGI